MTQFSVAFSIVHKRAAILFFKMAAIWAFFCCDFLKENGHHLGVFQCNTTHYIGNTTPGIIHIIIDI